jgi:hypothetical protein
VTEAGGNVVSGPDLRVSEPERADNAAYALAYKAARARAEAYASAAGLKVTRILAIRDGSAEGPPIAYGYATADAGAVATEQAPPPPVMTRSAAPFQSGITTREGEGAGGLRARALKLKKRRHPRSERGGSNHAVSETAAGARGLRPYQGHPDRC